MLNPRSLVLQSWRCRGQKFLKRCCQALYSTEYNGDNEQFVEFPSDLALQGDLDKKSHRDQTRKSFRPKVDPSLTSIMLFPGQGSQFVGMGKRLLDHSQCKELFENASDIVKFDLLKLCLEGPIDVLSRTEVSQVATLVTSVAALAKLREENYQAIENCVGAAGFSVGEYTALVFAGVISFEDAVQLVKARALAMQAACDAQHGGLMTVFLSHESKLNYAMLAAREYCKQRLDISEPVCSIANYLFSEVKVIGGHIQALEFIKANAKQFKIKRVKMLPVSGAFHTGLMKPAVKDFRSALKEVELQKPILPIHSNVTCAPYGRKESLMRNLLIEQLCKPVKWEQTIHTLYQRPSGVAFPSTYEVGPGGQLGTILKMVNFKAYQSYHSVHV